MKRSAAVAELKAHLSRYLGLVKTGEEIVVTERGVPVARLVPVDDTVAPDLERMRALEQKGLLRVGWRKLPRDFWKLPRPRDPEGLVRKALARERDEGW
jgi:prevent-host-death family protein